MTTASPTLRRAAWGVLMTRGVRSRRVRSHWLHLVIVKQTPSSREEGSWIRWRKTGLVKRQKVQKDLWKGECQWELRSMMSMVKPRRLFILDVRRDRMLAKRGKQDRHATVVCTDGTKTG